MHWVFSEISAKNAKKFQNLFEACILYEKILYFCTRFSKGQFYD